MFKNILVSKREFFESAKTLSYDFRIDQLRKLKASIRLNENNILRALERDLGKSEFEGFTAEIGIVYKEIDHAIKKLRSWMKRKRVKTPIYLQPAKSYIYHQPKGVVLIISPWNYPFQLTMSPLVGAIAAGNCVVLKPSNEAKETAKIIEDIIKNTFPEEYISTIQGPGSQVVAKLIESFRFDHIFFTGSAQVGRQILSQVADELIPVTLELGGKSPLIVHKDADIDLAAKRITWAKFYNAGQTCVAPDYLLVHQSVKEKLIDRIKYYIGLYYGDDPEASKDFGRIINDKRFDRLLYLLEDTDIIKGGDFNKKNRYLSPSLLDNISMDMPIMKEEIFGPILPIIEYTEYEELEEIIKKNPYPLALYVFTKDKDLEDYFISNLQFGGGCVNHLISHVANPNLVFGGFGYSGMGSYHAKKSFETFSHEKSIYKSATSFDPNILYPPYKENLFRLIKRFFRK